MLSKLGHDLRDPVGTMVFLTEVLMNQLGDRSSDQEHRMFKDVLQIGQKALQLTDDLLELSAARKGRLILNPAETDLNQILNQTVSLQRAAADEKRVSLILCPADPVRLKLDQIKMLRALNELVSNAIEASEPGSAVYIRTRSGAGRADILVHDQAAAIPREQAQQLFAPLADSNGIPTRGANGLGLAMARAIVKAHGGRIRIVSKPGWGNRFIISLVL